MSDPAFYAGQTLPADQLQDLGEYGSWTPTLTVVTLGTNPTLGTAAVTSGNYHRNGRLITLVIDITFGSAGVVAGSGTYQIGGLPFNIDTLGAGMAMGGAMFALDGTNRYVTVPRVQSSTAFTLMRTNITATENVTELTATAPFTWGTGDSLRGTVTYIGDP
jgi:hypothetical protein